MLKGVSQEEKLKEHMVKIGMDQQLSNSALYEQKCSENIKKLYKYDGKCDIKQPYKAIIGTSMVSNN